MAEDLYALLGVTKNATEAEIKKAYRQQARKYHPDVNKEAGAEDKFKNISKAYSILSDPKKKAQYDQFGVTDDSPGGGQGGFGGGFEGFSGGGFEDIFDVFFGGQGGGGRRRRSNGPAQGEDLRYDLEITLEEAAKGISKNLKITHLDSCSRCKGSGAQPGTKKTSCSHCHGSGQVKSTQRTFLGSFSQVTTCPTCHGEGSVISNPCILCHGKGVEKATKDIKVDIPAGVETGVKLRVSKEGNAGTNGGPSGDLYVFISVKKHTYFKREYDDVSIEVSLPFTDLILGTEIEVPTLTGKAKLKVPAGTQPDTTFRLKEKGIPHLQGRGNGDQYIHLKVQLPKKLSGKEKDLVEQLAQIQNGSKKKNNLFEYVSKLF